MANVKLGKKLQPFTAERRRRMAEAHKGEKSNFWRGGLTKKHLAIRNSIECKLWREAVFKRDDYICQECSVRGKTLNADHIKQFAYYPELRFELSNGRTLCVSCHKKTPTYGYRVFQNNLITKE